jgi:predicted RNA binding protein YcfA (HicA-like mRNA interferase family)
MKVRDMVRALEQAGWYLARHGKGDHKVYKHADHEQHISIDGEPGDDVSPGILSQARRISGLNLR